MPGGLGDVPLCHFEDLGRVSCLRKLQKGGFHGWGEVRKGQQAWTGKKSQQVGWIFRLFGPLAAFRFGLPKQLLKNSSRIWHAACSDVTAL
jgi:hypothetical protein